MIRIECAFEHEMLQVVSEGRWPDRCDEELRAHATVCAVCADLVEVAAVLAHAHETTVRDARVPDSGVVWFRTQMRLKQDALRASQRTVTIIQAAMLGVGLAASVAVLGSMSLLPSDAFGAILRVIRLNSSLLLALLAWLVVVPLATRFALTGD